MSTSAILYDVAYHTAILLIYRPLLNEARGGNVAKLALHTVTVAAASVSHLLRRFCAVQSLRTASPQIINYVTSTAIIHLLNATVGNETRIGKQSAVGLSAVMGTLESIRNLGL